VAVIKLVKLLLRASFQSEIKILSSEHSLIKFLLFGQIIDYENRLRNFSSPDKIFRYFATVKIVHQDSTSIYMTPFDFLRAITPNMKQPEVEYYEQFLELRSPSLSPFY
jgi:hypothetical protein